MSYQAWTAARSSDRDLLLLYESRACLGMVCVPCLWKNAEITARGEPGEPKLGQGTSGGELSSSFLQDLPWRQQWEQNAEQMTAITHEGSSRTVKTLNKNGSVQLNLRLHVIAQANNGQRGELNLRKSCKALEDCLQSDIGVSLLLRSCLKLFSSAKWLFFN